MVVSEATTLMKSWRKAFDTWALAFQTATFQFQHFEKQPVVAAHDSKEVLKYQPSRRNQIKGFFKEELFIGHGWYTFNGITVFT